MNKKLLAMAVGAALVAGPALVAQAEVKLYGHAHMSVDMIDQDVAVATTDDGGMFVSTNSSRFGIRATEDLGGGLKAAAQYEFLFAQDVGNSTPITNRDNYVGLEGGFGALRLGNIDSATKDIGGIADMFYREQLGESRSIIAEPGLTLGAGNPDGRVANGIHYFSPNMSGLTFKFQYGADEAADENVMAANLRWTSGPLTFGVGYLNAEVPTAPGADDQTTMRAAAKFDVGGGFAVAALWQSVSALGGVNGADRDTMGLGASFKAGNNIFKAQYYVADEIDGLADTGGDLLAIGFDHIFSKTTKGYITYAATSNDNNTRQFVVGGNGHAGVITATTLPFGGDTSGFSAGMIVDF